MTTEDPREARPEADPDPSQTKSRGRSDIAPDLTADTDITPIRSTEDIIVTDPEARMTGEEETLLGAVKSHPPRFKLPKKEEQISRHGIEKMRKQLR
jgi:hypothetical protein